LSTACSNRLQLTDRGKTPSVIGHAINDRLQNSRGIRAHEDYSMKPLKAMTTACVVLLALLLAASIYSGARGSMKMERLGQGRRSHSDLERDSLVLADDMRRLRRSLRHGVDPLQIARQRDGIRQDWLNIVADRGLKGSNFSPELVSFNPYRFVSRW
jgi:hypothetical protein